LGVTIRLAERQTSRLALNGGDVKRLSPAELREEQKKTMAVPPLTYGFLAKILFVVSVAVRKLFLPYWHIGRLILRFDYFRLGTSIAFPSVSGLSARF
jgi:hypothetical protein